MTSRQQVATPFASILRRAIERTPGAIGGTLAAGDGETVDFHLEVSSPPGAPRLEEHDWHMLTAHHGILLSHIRSALRTFHVGDPQVLVFSHRGMHVLLRALDEDYFALLAVDGSAGVATAVYQLGRAAEELRREIA